MGVIWGGWKGWSFKRDRCGLVTMSGFEPDYALLLALAHGLVDLWSRQDTGRLLYPTRIIVKLSPRDVHGLHSIPGTRRHGSLQED